MSYKLFQFCIINIITIIIDYFGSIGTEDNDIIHQRQKVIDHMFGGRKVCVCANEKRPIQKVIFHITDVDIILFFNP